MKNDTVLLLKDADLSAPVCVTGASGYVAGWIIRYLLEMGATVHATVRKISNQKSTAHLVKLADGLPGTLKFFEADLLSPGSFDEAVKGCGIVIHTASPFIIKGFKDPQTALIKPAVQGTENVLEACNRIASVQRVVLTSSIVSVFGDNIDALKAKDGVLDETDWNTTSSAAHQPYPYSKTMAEKKAWEMHRLQTRWHLVTINPGVIMGPSLTPSSQSTSIDMMRDLGSGAQRTGVPNLELGIVDVRDVAEAHVLAAFRPDLSGRFIVNAESATLLRLATILRTRFPKYPFPRMEVPKLVARIVAPILAGVSAKYIDRNVGYPIAFDNARSREVLGLKYRNLNQTLFEHFAQLIDDGLLPRR